MKKIIQILLCLLLLLFSSMTIANLHWDVAAYIWTGTAVAVTAASMVGAAPIVLAGTLAVGVHAAVIGLYWDDINPLTTATGATASRGLSVVLDPNTPLVTPPEWTAPVASSANPNLEPTPPKEHKQLNPYKGEAWFPTTKDAPMNPNLDDICIGGTFKKVLPEFVPSPPKA